MFFGPIGKTSWPPWHLIGKDIFNFSSETAVRNSTKLDRKGARSQRPLPSVCLSGWSVKQDGRPGIWLAETFFTSPLKPLNGIQRNLSERKQDLNVLYQVMVFWGWSVKQDGRPGLWMAESFSTSPLKSPYGIQRNLKETRSQRLLPSLYFSGQSVHKIGHPGRFLWWHIVHVLRCTMHDMWPFWPLVFISFLTFSLKWICSTSYYICV